MNEIDRFLESSWLPRVLTQEQAEFLQRGINLDNGREELQLPTRHTLFCGCAVEVGWLFKNASAHPTAVVPLRWDTFYREQEIGQEVPGRPQHGESTKFFVCDHPHEYMNKMVVEVTSRLWDQYQRLFMGKTDGPPTPNPA